jgi:hypothetical protein
MRRRQQERGDLWEIWRWARSVSTGGGGTGIVTWGAARSNATLPTPQGERILPTALYVPR